MKYRRTRLMIVPIAALATMLSLPAAAQADRGRDDQTGKPGRPATERPSTSDVPEASEDSAPPARPPKGDRQKAPSTTVVVDPSSDTSTAELDETTEPSSLPSRPGSNDAEHHPTPNPEAVLRQLDEWTTKISSSSLNENDQTVLLAAIDHLRSGVASGTLNADDLKLVRNLVQQSLATKHASPRPSVESPDTTTPDSGGEDDQSRDDGEASDIGRRQRGAHNRLDKTIAAVEKSTLPDEVKQQLLDVLNAAKATVSDPTLSPEQVVDQLREMIRKEKAERVQRAADRLTSFSARIAELATTAAALPDSVTTIASAQDKVTQADALLAGALDVSTVKSAWRLLHDARKELQGLLEANAAATSTTVQADPPS